MRDDIVLRTGHLAGRFQNVKFDQESWKHYSITRIHEDWITSDDTAPPDFAEHHP